MGARLSTGSPSPAHVRSGSTAATTTTTGSSTHHRSHHHGDVHPQDSDASSDEESPRATRRLHHFLFALRGKLNDIQCPVCSKTIPSDTFDVHILQCLSKPRIDYNEDVLTEDKGECVICLEELEDGQKIARLPCLCIYHKQSNHAVHDMP
ncbi:unnamed protein product [Didymodactylos carnosus]|uniref:RING-type E3 ubiquitin transferase n=1 Tax=Didymodactylos carnosus TaxID=1234261 RepID=A0A813RBY0_9BILA|nr:unnamed protein product [Didymodactylos carnosus]CAF0791350.1 unnamed protein product [Didymodactylos carnosus]CAF3561774.1 unnamed protein product [Didymodactylos carnosus]CAF3573939.1 unnamed protein product [Didymodactylos carnosus]